MSVRVSDFVWNYGPEARSDRLVLLAIADFSNDAGECWPSMSTIGERARMSERGARKVVRRLEQDGWLETTVGGGRGGASRYRINMQKGKSSSRGDTENPEPQRERQPDDTRNVVTVTRNMMTDTRNGRSAEPSVTTKDPSEEEYPLDSPADEFERIWSVYPKKVEKKTALQTWIIARRKHGFEEILAGLQRYIRSREGQDQQYTKSLHRWLKRECWNDEPYRSGPRTSADDLRYLANVTASDDLALLMGPSTSGGRS